MEDNRVLVFEVTEDVIKTCFSGPGDATDYCYENNLFFCPISKGELVYAPVCNFSMDEFLGLTGSYVKFIKRWTFNVRGFKKGALATFVEAHPKNISMASSLIEVFKFARRYAMGSSPRSTQVKFIGILDGNMTFSEFLYPSEQEVIHERALI